MLDRIHAAWGKSMPIVSLLMIDVSGAYDNVSHALFDSQGALQSLARPWMPSVQLYLESCLNYLAWFCRPRCSSGTPMYSSALRDANAERVDELAKEAAAQPADWLNPSNQYMLLAAAFITRIRRTTRMRWVLEGRRNRERGPDRRSG